MYSYVFNEDMSKTKTNLIIPYPILNCMPLHQYELNVYYNATML